MWNGFCLLLSWQEDRKLIGHKDPCNSSSFGSSLREGCEINLEARMGCENAGCGNAGCEKEREDSDSV